MARKTEQKDGGKTIRKKLSERVRDLSNSRTAKVIGLSALAAPVVALLAWDLRKPGSTSRKALAVATATLLGPLKKDNNGQVDITDKVEAVAEDDE